MGRSIKCLGKQRVLEKRIFILDSKEHHMDEAPDGGRNGADCSRLSLPWPATMLEPGARGRQLGTRQLEIA